MSNVFKLCPTHFSRGAKNFVGGFPPLVTVLKQHTKKIMIGWFLEVLEVAKVVFNVSKLLFSQVPTLTIDKDKQL